MKSTGAFALIFSALLLISMPLNAFGAQIAFNFGDTHVTVEDGGQIFRFPMRVFDSQFGVKNPSDVIEISDHYKGFLVTTSHEDNALISTPKSKELSYYGDLIFYEYYDKVFSVNLNGEIYSWTIPIENRTVSTRTPAEESADLNLLGETETVFAKKVGNTIQYYDDSERLLWTTKLQ